MVTRKAGSFALLPLLLISTAALACECAPPPPPCQAVGESELIFLGTVTAVADLPNHFKTARMKVDRSFKGDVPPAVELFDDGMCDGPDLQLGKRYLMYTSGRSDVPLSSRGCTRSRAAEYAAEDLKFLDRYTSGKTTTRISGVVRLGSNEPDENESTRKPLKNVEVTLSSDANQLHATTNAAGMYYFLNVTPGDYAIDANLPGYYLDWAPGALKLSPKGCVETTLLMTVDRRVEGEVRQKNGASVSSALVELISDDPNLDPSLRPVLLDISDEAGHYRINGIPPGSYYLGINIASTPTKEHPYPSTFYPNTSDRERAVRIIVKAKSSVQRFDLQVASKLSLITIKGTIKTAAGKPPLAKDCPHVRISGPELEGKVEENEIPIDANGHFQFELCEGIKYSAFAFSGLPPSTIHSAPVEFTPTKENDTLILTLDNSQNDFMQLRRRFRKDHNSWRETPIAPR